MRILFVTGHKPWPATYGTRIRVLAELKALESMGKVDLLFVGPSAAFDSNSDFYQHRTVLFPIVTETLIENCVSRYLPFMHVDRETLQYLTPMLPLGWYFSKADKKSREQFQKQTRKNYDMIFYVRPRCYWLFDGHGTAKSIVDIDDVMSLGAAGESLKSRIKRMFIKQYEMRMLRSVSAALVCSRDDCMALNHHKIKIFPNPIPSHGQECAEIVAGDSNNILFIGPLNYYPNRQGVRFFAEKVLPLIRKKKPDVKVTVIGAYGSSHREFLHSLEGIDFLGRVENIAPFIHNTAIEVVPILEGMGTRIKILEALSFGKPVVATSVGAYGIELSEEEGLFRTDDPEEMAEICMDLMGNPAKRMELGRKGKEKVYALYGQEALNKRMQEIVDSIL